MIFRIFIMDTGLQHIMNYLQVLGAFSYFNLPAFIERRLVKM